jgi:SPASM domain peptide maturase of grasp-with-spasm system
MKSSRVLDFEAIKKEESVDYKNLCAIVDYLVANNLAFFTNDPLCFPALDTNFEIPEIINNAILEVSDFLMNYLPKIVSEMTLLRCRHVEIRSYDYASGESLVEIVNAFKGSFVRSFTIINKYDEEIRKYDFNKLLSENTQILNYTIHSAPLEFVISAELEQLVYITSDSISSKFHCGNVGLGGMVVNSKMFTESLHFNSCLNRKISIDQYGNIKNCPTMDEIFGNIKKDSVYEIANDLRFQKNWLVTKDSIDTCKVCEYRYACVDCRAILENPNDSKSKPLKCGYDPHTGEWSEWSDSELRSNTFDDYLSGDILRK